MRFVFDPAKERANLRKHGLDFSHAAAVFADPLSRTIYDREENGEHRYHCFGIAGPTRRLILIVHVFPDPNDGELVRVISIRKATKAERRRYEETLE